MSSAMAMRALCMGLEVVTASGEVMDLLPALKKNNTGYDLINLMVGSEGTLGIITAASLKLVPRPEAYATAMVVVPDVSAALKLMNFVQAQTAGRVEAFELFGQLMYDLCVKYLDHITAPFSYSPPLSVIVEIAAGSAEDAKAGADGKLALTAQLEEILAEAFEAGIAEDAVVAYSEAQRRNLWTMREDTLDAMQRHGNWLLSDVSFQVSICRARLPIWRPPSPRLPPDRSALPLGIWAMAICTAAPGPMMRTRRTIRKKPRRSNRRCRMRWSNGAAQSAPNMESAPTSRR